MDPADSQYIHITICSPSLLSRVCRSHITCYHKQTLNRFWLLCLLWTIRYRWGDQKWRSRLPHSVIWYDRIEEFNVDSKAECDQLNLAHIARKNIYIKEESKTNKHQCRLSSVHVQVSPEGIRKTTEERICDTDELSLEWKVEGMIEGESKGGDCDQMICAGWGEPGREWTKWGWRNQEGSRFHR